MLAARPSQSDADASNLARPRRHWKRRHRVEFRDGQEQGRAERATNALRARPVPCLPMTGCAKHFEALRRHFRVVHAHAGCRLTGHLPLVSISPRNAAASVASWTSAKVQTPDRRRSPHSRSPRFAHIMQLTHARAAFRVTLNA